MPPYYKEYTTNSKYVLIQRGNKRLLTCIKTGIKAAHTMQNFKGPGGLSSLKLSRAFDIEIKLGLGVET